MADATVDVASEAPHGEFGEPDELFAKIEAERVEELNAKLEQRVADATDDESEADDANEDDEGDGASDNDANSDVDLEPIADERISFDDFQDLDIRVGEVIEADPVEDADELARLQVDIGHEMRQLVAGIKQLHDLDSLPGTRVIIVANLEKAELFGVESNGMLLAAGEEADLLTTQGESPPGTRIQ
ncbi:MAG: EMAP domain protein [Halonotius sp. J07HN6]|nr:MAG: EMAP domain protein [Halonotius sp. J07HN6]